MYSVVVYFQLFYFILFHFQRLTIIVKLPPASNTVDILYNESAVHVKDADMIRT